MQVRRLSWCFLNLKLSYLLFCLFVLTTISRCILLIKSCMPLFLKHTRICSLLHHLSVSKVTSLITWIFQFSCRSSKRCALIGRGFTSSMAITLINYANEINIVASLNVWEIDEAIRQPGCCNGSIICCGYLIKLSTAMVAWSYHRFVSTQVLYPLSN